MNVSSKITGNGLQHAAGCFGLGVLATIVVAVNIINGIGRQFTQEDSCLHQLDAYLTGKVISYGESLKQYALSFFVQKELAAVPVKLMKNDQKEEVTSLVKGCLETIQEEAYEEALIDINEHHPLQLAKEDIARDVSIEVKKIVRGVLERKKTDRFQSWSDVEFLKRLLVPSASRHKSKYMQTFRIALELGLSCEEAKAIADQTKLCSPLDKDDLRSIIKRRQIGQKKGIQKEAKSLDLTDENSLQMASPSDSVLTKIPSWESVKAGVSPGSIKTI